MDNEVCPEIRQGIFLFPITLSSFYLLSAFSFNPLFRFHIFHIFHASRLHEIKQAHLLIRLFFLCLLLCAYMACRNIDPADQKIRIYNSVI